MQSLQHWARRHHWWLTMIEGAISVIIGILVLSWPGETLRILIGLVGIYAVLRGLIGLFIAVGMMDKPEAWGWQFAGSVSSIVGGLLLLKWPTPTLAILVLIVGLWAVSVGIIGAIVVITAHIMPRVGLLMLTWAITLLFGVLILFWPQLGLQAVITLSGVYAIVHGAVIVITTLRMRNHIAQHGKESPIYR